MIKLNNKNITYVALADSNNSLKAPKEIWYADSNNSVKLVYRRKDALIEGEDYEKYHWLVGDADAYINTLKYYRPYDDSVQMTFRDNLYPNRINKRNKHNVEEQIWGTSINTIHIRSYISGSTATDITIGNNILDSNTSESGITWGNYTIDGTINDSEQHSIYISSANNENKYSFTHNGTEKKDLSTRYALPEIVQANVLVFNGRAVTNGYFNGSFFNFIHYRNNVEITHLIPCKLLKPVPKWLDANGIRRQAGECGMIDLVSGKFYGNVNSVGTFTVENYYERKEWLQGRNGAYIDTNYYPIVGTDVFSVHFHYDGTTRNPDGGEQDAFGVNYKISDKNNFIRAFVNAGNKLSCSYYQYAGTWTTTNEYSKEWDIADLMIDDSNFKYVANGTDYLFANNGIQQQICPFSLFVFKNNDNVYNQNCYLHGDISSFKITDTSSNTKMNLIPCTITMDLPASMDANNTPRTKGTSGMWDLVSDRFYGNVANSGTFKAVNLAEGVDYEVHQWLKVEISANKARSFMTLPLNSSVFEFKRKFDVFGNLPYFSSNEHTYITGSGKKIAIYDKINGGQIEISSFTLNTGDVVDVVCDGQELYFNNQQFTMYENPWRIIYFRLNAAGSADFSTSKISIDGIDRYIPCKLLHSIPSKYDANGIARQAGECGMYDTVNDVFYGNVASSGSFTVEDDS